VKSRPPAVKLNLQRALESGVARYQGDYKISQPVTIENPLGELIFETNVEVFEEVLSKVLINAWEAYDDKPSHLRAIAIRTQLIEKPEEGKFVEIHVEDQGHGIDPEVRDHVFEPFISSKHTVGVGMGLTIARHALRNLGGEVTLIDGPNGGAIAILLHPVEKRPLKKSED
jgi:signal transduction histidine kinase